MSGFWLLTRAMIDAEQEQPTWSEGNDTHSCSTNVGFPKCGKEGHQFLMFLSSRESCGDDEERWDGMFASRGWSLPNSILNSVAEELDEHIIHGIVSRPWFMYSAFYLAVIGLAKMQLLCIYFAIPDVGCTLCLLIIARLFPLSTILLKPHITIFLHSTPSFPGIISRLCFSLYEENSLIGFFNAPHNLTCFQLLTCAFDASYLFLIKIECILQLQQIDHDDLVRKIFIVLSCRKYLNPHLHLSHYYKHIMWNCSLFSFNCCVLSQLKI